jgi:hypothetical protein
MMKAKEKWKRGKGPGARVRAGTATPKATRIAVVFPPPSS